MALLESNTGHSDFGVSFDGEDLNIVLPQTMLFDTNAAMMKFRLVTIIRDAVECNKVSFIEVHEPRGFGVPAEEESDETAEDTAEETATDSSDEDLSKLTVADLKARCKDAGLAVGGKKADLIARLSE